MDTRKQLSPLTVFRLCMSGALAGGALVGAVAPFFGIQVSSEGQLAGFLIGACVVAAFKFTHVI